MKKKIEVVNVGKLKLSLVILFTVVCFTNCMAMDQSNIVVIDDFEDRDFHLNPHWILPDPSRVTELTSEIVSGANNTKHALSLRFTIIKGGWGTLYVTKDDTNKEHFALSGCNRIRFWAKAIIENTDEMFIHIGEDDLTGWVCYVELSTEWKEYSFSSNNFTPLPPRPDINPEVMKKRQFTNINLSNIKGLAFVIEGVGEKGFVIDEIRLEKEEELR